MNISRFKTGGLYNWKNQPERLVYLGYNRSGNGRWHQFSLVGSDDVWCEIITSDLHMIEETVEDSKRCGSIGKLIQLKGKTMGINLEVGKYYRTKLGALVYIDAKLNTQCVRGRVIDDGAYQLYNVGSPTRNNCAFQYQNNGVLAHRITPCDDDSIVYEEPVVGDLAYVSDYFDIYESYKADCISKTVLRVTSTVLRITSIDYSKAYPYKGSGPYSWKFAIKVNNPTSLQFPPCRALSLHEVVDWVEHYGSTLGLVYSVDGGPWVESTFNTHLIDTEAVYMVAPVKKVNDPDDPKTWERGVKFFHRNREGLPWVLGILSEFEPGSVHQFKTPVSGFKFGRLATDEQVKAWDKIQEELG